VLHCALCTSGALELALGLRQSYGQLWLLDLRRNCIGDKGAIALSTCLPLVPSLQELVLSYNHIGEALVMVLR
jgi:hypothetical protein